MKLTDLFASLVPWDGEGRLDGSDGPGGATGDTGEAETGQQGVYASLEPSKGGTVRLVQPEEYRKFVLPDYPQAKTLPALVRHFKRTQPEYYEKIKSDVQRNGFTTPALARYTDPRGNALKRPTLMEGHHRAAVAHELGIPLPVGDYDNPADAEGSRAGNAKWFSENERPAQGISWEASRTAAQEHIGEPEYEEDDGYGRTMWDRWHPRLQPTIHRALAVTFPPGHPAMDDSLSMHARAKAALEHVTKGGLGMHWTDEPSYPRKHFQTRLIPGETPVVVHAKTPPREHVEDNGWVHEDRAIRDWDTEEREVPVKRNAPLQITGITWGNHHHDFHEPITKRAAAKPQVYRGLTVVLPTDVHQMVHDESQPVASRAHLLLAHVRKEKPEITSEDVHGTTGGVGNFWSPSESKAEEYGEQGGFRAYHDHEGQHGCGDEWGDHGCPTTNVVLHAQEPSEKHHWTEINRPGEKYDRDISWRLPVRPDAPLNITGISWKQGDDNKPVTERDYSSKEPYRSYDFSNPVKKRAARGTDSEGHEVELHPQDGWQHRDGSVSHEDGTTVSDHPVQPYTHDHPWLPQGRYWGPNSAQVDQRLFDGDKLRPEVRQDVLGRIGKVLRLRYPTWQRWTEVYFAGSQAAQWTDPKGEGNGDFDIILGIDWPVFRQDNPDVKGSDEQVAQELTDLLWHQANISDYYFTLADGRKVGPFDRTFFVNPRAWDIRALHPYAAYDVTHDTWAVHPLQVPANWSAQSLPESYWDYAEALAKTIDAIGTLPPEEKHRMAANLWEELHSHRSDAFADGGKGLYDLANVIEKYLDQNPSKPWARLVEWKNQAPSGPEPWVPTTARRTTLTDLFTTAEVRYDLRDPQSGADYEGIMVALVPPRSVCEALQVEKGEPVESMHVTLAYMGGKDEYPEELLDRLPALVQAWAKTHAPLTSSVGGVGTFVNPEQHVLWAAVDIPHGTTFRDDLVRYLEAHGFKVRHDHGWTPHITLAYRNSHVRFLPKVEPVTWEDSQIWACVGGRWESFPLLG